MPTVLIPHGSASSAQDAAVAALAAEEAAPHDVLARLLDATSASVEGETGAGEVTADGQGALTVQGTPKRKKTALEHYHDVDFGWF